MMLYKKRQKLLQEQFTTILKSKLLSPDWVVTEHMEYAEGSMSSAKSTLNFMASEIIQHFISSPL